MADTNKERELGQWLNQAIERFGAAEPRPGLEERVLANLQAAKERRQDSQGRWWWALVVAGVAAAILVAFWVGVSNSGKHIVERGPVAVREHPSAANVPKPGHQENVDHHQRPHNPALISARNARVEPVKLDQFPSPQPLTEQETMLARYVEEFPERAVLVARAQTELRKQDEREMAAPSSQTGNAPNLDQPE